MPAETFTVSKLKTLIAFVMNIGASTVDILLYGQEIWETEHLKVPHPYMVSGSFVLVPLVEIADDLVDPKTGKLQNYLSQLNTSGVRKLELWTSFYEILVVKMGNFASN